MLKKEMSEADIEQSFEEFFQKSNSSIKNVLVEFDSFCRCLCQEGRYIFSGNGDADS